MTNTHSIRISRMWLTLLALTVIFLIVTPSHSQQIWHYEVGPNSWDAISDVHWHNESQVYVSGSQWIFNSERGFVAAIDTDGDVIDGVSFVPGDDSQATSANAFVVQPNGHLVVAGKDVELPPVESNRGILWNINPAGEIVWTRYFDDWDNPYQPPFTAMDQNEHGFILLIRSTFGDGTGLLYVDTEGEPIWPFSTSYNNTNGERVIALPSQRFAFCGGPPGNVTMVDSSGAVLWHMPFVGHNMFYNLSRAHDSGIVAVSEQGVHKLDETNGHPIWFCPLFNAEAVEALPDGGYVVFRNTADFFILDDDGNIIETFQYGGLNGVGFVRSDIRDNGSVVVSGMSGSDNVLVFLGAPPRPSVILLPVNNTIPIPPTGGLIVYHAILQNPLPQPANRDVWTSIITPNGQQLPFQLFHPTLPADQVRQFQNLNFLVPPSASDGVYWFKAAVGDFPNTVVSADSFQFSKSPWLLTQTDEISE
jgi:hypothetical protein